MLEQFCYKQSDRKDPITSMKDYTTIKGFCPHQISTKVGSINLYRYTHDIDFVCRRYHISKASLMRWNKIYDGTRESLIPKSHKPHSPHPNAHTEEELKWIKDYHRRNPNISICELYGKLREDKGYTRNPGSLYRVFVRLGFRKRQNLQRKSLSITRNTTRLPFSALSGSLTLKLFLPLVIPVKTERNSTNTQ